MQLVVSIFLWISLVESIEKVRLSEGYDLSNQFPTGTIITIRYQNDVNCGTCESEIRLYTDVHRSLYPDPRTRDYPIRIKVSNDAQSPIETDRKQDGQINCRMRSQSHVERSPDLDSIWRIDIVKVSSTSLRVFFQGYPAASLDSPQSLDGIRSLVMYSEVAGYEQYMEVIYPNSLVTSLNVERWYNGGRGASSEVALDIGSFPIGTRYRFVTFMNSYDNTNTFRFVGFRLKHHMMKTPVAVMQSWKEKHQRISLNYKEEYDNYSRNNIICFDDYGLGDLAHFDLTRERWNTVKIRLFHVGSSTVECQLSIPQGRDLDQPLQVIVANGASLLYLNKSSITVPC